MKYTVLLIILACTICKAQNGPIKVYLNSGKVISTRYIYVDQGGGLGRAFVRIDPSSKARITIDSVDHIEGTDNDGKSRYIRPMRWRLSTIWAERTFNSDRIAMYYVGIQSGGFGTVSMNWKYYQYSKDDGPLQKLTIANVDRDVKDDPKALEYVKKSRANSLVQGLLYTAGGALIIAAAAKDLAPDDGPAEDGSKVPVAAVVGIGCLILPLALKPSKQRNLVHALETYK